MLTDQLTRLAPGVTRSYLLRHRICPVTSTPDGRLTVAVTDSHAPEAVHQLAAAYGQAPECARVADSDLDQLIERLATSDARASESWDETLGDEDLSLEDVRELANQPPVARYVNLLVREATDAGASDIHLESALDGLRARFRLDGVLQAAPEPPRSLERAVVSRLKAMAELDVTERRRPQDGRIRVRLENQELDLRISCVPTVHGESVVLRLLDRGGRAVALTDLGMTLGQLGLVTDAVALQSGLILVCGPTGSGKTTTLYSALQNRSAAHEKIVTVEEPVEYRLQGVTQVPVQRQAGLSFAAALRALLRQDPDVVMVGEMRDSETAEIAVQAALTGHLVLSTVHTNDALRAVLRLSDLGVPEFLSAATLELVVAQRLVRRLCLACRREGAGDAKQLEALGFEPTLQHALYEPVGCRECRGTGFRGRVGIFEAIRVSEGIRSVIAERSGMAALRDAAQREGFIPMTHHARDLVARGLTGVQEALRAVRA
ncbi:MAG: GspE/PulE family protein [Gemmatimonadales bacterium]|nr:GspE/PulE family protein [Gemmatimonadales bacterium]